MDGGKVGNGNVTKILLHLLYIYIYIPISKTGPRSDFLIYFKHILLREISEERE